MYKDNSYQRGIDAYKDGKKLTGEEPEEYDAGFYDAMVDDEGLDSPIRFDFTEDE